MICRISLISFGSFEVIGRRNTLREKTTSTESTYISRFRIFLGAYQIDLAGAVGNMGHYWLER